MRYKLRVTREDGSVRDEEVEAGSYLEARESMLAEPDVIDATLARTASASAPAKSSNIQDGIDQYVGTEQDVKDIVGFD